MSVAQGMRASEQHVYNPMKDKFAHGMRFLVHHQPGDLSDATSNFRALRAATSNHVQDQCSEHRPLLAAATVGMEKFENIYNVG